MPGAATACAARRHRVEVGTLRGTFVLGGVRVSTVRSSAGSTEITKRRRFGAERLRGQITAVLGTEG